MPPTQRKPGRPRALDDAKRRDLCALVAVGADFQDAARYVGCAPCTARREAARDPAFSAALGSASHAARQIPLARVREFARCYWRLAARSVPAAALDRSDEPAPRPLTPAEFAVFLAAVQEDVAGDVMALVAAPPDDEASDALPPNDGFDPRDIAQRAKPPCDHSAESNAALSAQNSMGPHFEHFAASEAPNSTPTPPDAYCTTRAATCRQRAKLQIDGLNSSPSRRQYKIHCGNPSTQGQRHA